MRTGTTSLLPRVRSCYESANKDLVRILLNATSSAEANLALDVLRDMFDEKDLVAACNLREVLAAIPSSPFAMRVDEDTLIRTAGLRRSVAAMSKTLDDGTDLVVTTAGNLVLDILVRDGRVKYFWNAVPVTDDFVNDQVLDLIVSSEVLLDAVVDLVKCMGVVFNPKFYLSLDDWKLEHVAEMFEGLESLF